MKKIVLISFAIILALGITTAYAKQPHDAKIVITNNQITTKGTWVAFNVHIRTTKPVRLVTAPELFCVQVQQVDGIILGCLTLPLTPRTGVMATIVGCSRVQLVASTSAVEDTYLVTDGEATRQDNPFSTRWKRVC